LNDNCSNLNNKSDKPDPAVMALFQTMLMAMPQGCAYLAQQDAQQNSGTPASGSGANDDGQSDTASSDDKS
jgi:hypothetical protein